MMSTYLGSITMVLKFPLTSAASTKGLHRYKGFGALATGDAGTTGLGGTDSRGEKVAEVGVVDLFGALGARVIDRLHRCERRWRVMEVYYIPDRVEEAHAGSGQTGSWDFCEG